MATDLEKVDLYKEKCKKEGEKLLMVVFPAKVLELNGIIDSDKLQLSRIPDISQEVAIPCPPVILESDVNHDGDGEPMAKKLKSISGTPVMALPSGPVEANKHLAEVINMVKPHVIDLVNYANKIKMWISYLIPRIEDGNNFGVSIQEDTLAEARQVESEVAAYLDQVSRYHITRAKLVSKVAKYPHVMDYRQSIRELDEKEFLSLRLVLIELRNQYASLHDLIVKNLEKIKKPRSSNADNMY